MARVVIVFHVERAPAVVAAKELATWLADHGHEPRFARADAEVAGVPEFGCDEHELGPGADLAVSLGGDGNMLRTIRYVVEHGVPVLGVNYGQLGYLTEVEPHGAVHAVERFFAGDYELQERMTLHIAETPQTGSAAVAFTALNEAVVEKVDSGKVVRLALHINDDFFTTYATDGLIVATPTGSTAYSLSARGPIIDPLHRALLLTPVAPHMLFDRSLVLSPDDTVRIEVLADRGAALAIDGRIAARLDVGAMVECRASPRPARLVSFGQFDFHARLKAKFQLNDR